ncbi:head-tail connector protein [Staphylococcus saprophyticus]|uniref:head-tail connector protein n=1 Tax=Staphylococcus TaxID=1279 RepID=UPI0008531F52|nr:MULTISPECIES: head-tail connector protein [Staphylococcus]MCD8910670.1 head-tail connector protein [Staphylococcus gallinarum]MCD8911225.1 head-tail connector protein [Staphylococcus gallinarum]MDK1673413.1 head-tail connector protein [Staphylococcus saprophyticus]MDW3873116.1 head-tail connector protein [Staphylococcus saprophyticus]MDW3969363.1 head-tail connector protein [Staphylococcus saprophyticus]
MIITIEEGRNALRVDGDYNDDVILPLIESIPDYLYLTTGKDWDDGEQSNPLAQTTAKFILQLWFDPQTQDSERLKRTIDGLLVSLTALGRSYNG